MVSRKVGENIRSNVVCDGSQKSVLLRFVCLFVCLGETRQNEKKSADITGRIVLSRLIYWWTWLFR